MHRSSSHNFTRPQLPPMSKSNVKMGFQGQLQVDEVLGDGNIYTAEFWQYDARLGRRWNIDPVFKSFESSYSCLGNNPILNIDPKGDDWFVNKQTGRLIFINDAKTMNNNSYGKAEDYENLGNDDLLGKDLVKDIGFMFYDVKPAQKLMKEHGYEKAKRVTVLEITHTESLPDGDVGSKQELESHNDKILSTDITYVKPDELDKRDVISSNKKRNYILGPNGGTLTEKVKYIVTYNKNFNVRSSIGNSNNNQNSIGKTIGNEILDNVLKKVFKKK